jgi:hypothetical protein
MNCDRVAKIERRNRICFMLPSAHINRVGVGVVSFRSSIAHPAYTLYLRFTEFLAVSAQDLGGERIAGPFS